MTNEIMYRMQHMIFTLTYIIYIKCLNSYNPYTIIPMFPYFILPFHTNIWYLASSILYLASGIWQSIWHLASGISHTNLQYHELIPIFVKTHLLHFSPFHLLHYLFPLVALQIHLLIFPIPLVAPAMSYLSFHISSAP